MNRIANTFAALKEQSRAGLIPFIMAGDPDMEHSLKLLLDLPSAGADLIEIGIPFSDPMADGPVIQAAGLRALKSGATVKKTLEMVQRFRAQNSDTPIILMGYYNPVYHYGVEAFCRDARTAGVDGLILVDLPPEEEAEFKPHAQKNGLDCIRLIAPTSTGARQQLLLTSASGFVYYISITGITGAASADTDTLRTAITALKGQSKLPVAVGFGIRSPEQVRAVASFADAVVVGSALVEVIGQHPHDRATALSFVRGLAAAL